MQMEKQKKKKNWKTITLKIVWVLYAIFSIVVWLPKADALLSSRYEQASEHVDLNSSWNVQVHGQEYTNVSLSDSDMRKLEEGVYLDSELTLPAKIEKINDLEYLLTIHEGKFHQVKRMIDAVGKKVTYLKRISFGPLILDENLALGSYRYLTDDEILKLSKKD